MQARPERLGRYLVYEPFAQGGMGTVSLGRMLGDVGFSRVVAIKRPHTQLVDEDDVSSMLIDEARVASRVRHPNVVETIDVVRVGHEISIVMEYVHGVSLAKLCGAARRCGESVPYPILSALFVDALRGLHAAHRAQAADGAPLEIVHRDVSPKNMLVGVDGVTRVLDFGVAKALRRDYVSVSGEVKGTIAYMSPEQVRGKNVTRQSDLFMTGAVFWEALTGKKPFGFEDDQARLIEAILTVTPPRPGELVPDLPPALDAVVMKAMAKHPRARFGTAEEMALAIADACPPAPAEDVARLVDRLCGDQLDYLAERVRAIESAALEPEPESAPAKGDTVVAVAATRPSRPKRRRRPLGMPLAITLFAVGLGIGWFAMSRPKSRAPEPSVPVSAVGPSAPMPAPAPQPAPEVVAEPAPTGSATIDDPAIESTPAKTQARTVRRAPPAKDCDPPYSVDEKGKKHYHARCL